MGNDWEKGGPRTQKRFLNHGKSMKLKEYFRTDNPFDYIVLGFIMRIVGDVAGLVISTHISWAFFGIIAWLLIFKGFAKIPGHLHLPFDKSYGLLFRFYILLTAIMLVRGYMIDYSFPWWTTAGAINFHLFDSRYWLWTLMPFTVLIPVKHCNFRLMLNYSTLFGTIMLLAMVFFYREIVQATVSHAIGIQDEDLFSPESLGFYSYFLFIPLFHKYLPQKKWLFNVFFLFVLFVLLMMGGRRGGSLLTMILLIVSLALYVKSKPGRIQFLYWLIILILLCITGYFLLNSFASSYLLERGLNDNRTGVEEAMLSQMDSFDMIFGKGLNGRYYLPLTGTEDLDGWRYGIETGFLNIVLKGGYLMAYTHILLLVIPAIKGLFKSKNLFCKAGGFFILYNILSLWPFGILMFNLNFLFMWMMVVCCMNRKIRCMSDDEIKGTFFYNLK